MGTAPHRGWTADLGTVMDEPTVARVPRDQLRVATDTRRGAHMIIWTRWGIVVFLIFGLSVGAGFLIKAIVSPDGGSAQSGVFVGIGFLLGAVACWAFGKFALAKLDAPRPVVVWQQLAQPYVNEHGITVKQEAVPVRHPQTGEQLYSRPSSTLFFIPVRFWAYVIAALGVVTIVVNVVRG
jgi:hypothetical protein